MNTHLEAYALAFGLGLSVAAPIGPVNIEIIRRGLSIGSSAAFFLGCGAVSADCVYFGVSLAAASLAASVLASAWAVPIAFGVAGALLGWIGFMSIRSHSAPTDSDSSPAPKSVSPLRSYGFGLAMTLANPMTIAFWLSNAASYSAGQRGGATASWIRLAGVGSGAFSWVVFLVSLLAFARRWVNAAFLRWVNLISGAALLGYAGRFWIQAIWR